MKKGSNQELDELIEEITTDAYGEEEQLWAFRQAFEDDLRVPCAATIVGQPVQVMKFDYAGDDHRGLTATCTRSDGSKYIVSIVDVVMAAGSNEEKYVAAYCRCMGIKPQRRSKPKR